VQQLNDALVQQMAEMRREMEELRAATKGSSSVAANSRGNAQTHAPAEQVPRTLYSIADKGAGLKPTQPAQLTHARALQPGVTSDWLFELERFLTVLGIAETDFLARIGHFVALVDREMMEWWKETEEMNREGTDPIDTWPKFLVALKKVFVRANEKEEAAAALQRIQHARGETMVSFVTRARTLRRTAGDKIHEGGSNLLAMSVLRAVDENMYPFTVSRVRREFNEGKITALAQLTQRLMEESEVEPRNAFTHGNASSSSSSSNGYKPPTNGNRGPHKVNATEVDDSREGQESRDQAQLRVMVAALRAAGFNGPPAKNPQGKTPPGGLRRADVRDVKCFNCHKKGHYRADCGEPSVCRRCGKTGHFAHECEGERLKV
jgi:hypothetical protein